MSASPKPSSPQKKAAVQKANQNVDPSHDQILQVLKETDKLNKQQSVWIAIALIVLTIVAGSFLLSPTKSDTQGQVTELQNAVDVNSSEIDYMKQDQSLLKSLIPADWESRIDTLRGEVEQTRVTLEQAAVQVQGMSGDVLADGAGTLEQRLSALEGHVEQALGSPALAGVIQRVQALAAQGADSANLDQVIAQLNTLVQNTGASADNLNPALAEQVQNDPVLAETFQGVPQEDMKAAAVLFGLNQFRAALNRDNQPFAEDLQLVTNLMAADNPDFAARLQALSPHAESGVLTVEGLSGEFRTLAGDVVVASLQGEDVSVQERAQARMNELFSVQREGELVTGTDTQATLARSQQLIEEGAVEAAIVELQTLQGAEAEAVQPFITKAQATLAAKQVKDILNNTIQATAFGRSAIGGVTATGATGTGQYLKDGASGLVIYKP